MRSKRKKRGAAGTALSLDSFMDIVTNVIGALFFVVIYAALVSFGATAVVRIPLAEIADTERVQFEARDNTILFPEVDSLIAEMDHLWGKMDEMDFADWLEQYKQADIGNAYYTLNRTINTDSDSWYTIDRMVPVPDIRGEEAQALPKEQSTFRQHLEQFNPEQHHLIFYVRDESFAVFHTARRLGMESGFRMGWEPFEEGVPIRFSSRGRTIPIQ